LRTIEAGTVQYGLKLIWMILLLMSGDGRSGLPATAACRDAGRGNIGDHVTRPEIGGERLEPLDIDLELIAPRRRRHVERSERRLAHDAVDVEAVTRLKPPYRLLDIGIVNIVANRARIEIAGRRKPTAQIGYARMPIAQPQFIYLRHGRPAAARDDPVIGLHRVRCGFRGRCRKRRRGGPRHVNGARGLVEALAELAVVGLADQGIERLVFGQRPADNRACRRRAGKPAQK
jgi:hypothetical protein